MKQRYNPRLITTRRSYTPEEIAILFGTHKHTVFRWLKNGLRPIEKNTRPLLIMGEELRRFLTKKKSERKKPLQKNEYYCFKCRRATQAKQGTEETVPTGKKIGRDAHDLLVRKGKCEQCGIEVNRYAGGSRKD